ncbi:hypothetical protein AQJ67_02265 [Streptomyces caeruleatus]|uniref:Uncharacterized protein n=1 Tax=Streptomyces caeruleatus TaxID=661399 RepID=A0A124IAP1_9ACTN|nr:hypothetical protein AQJ67_02265 [Streptomyces caeruleatus]
MGVSISFVSATTEELDRAEEDPSWADQFPCDLYSGRFPIPGRLYGGPGTTTRSGWRRRS